MNHFTHEALPLQFSNKDHVCQKEYLLLITFSGRRRVLSTSAYNGGIRDDLSCVFNFDLSRNKTAWCELLAPTLEGHMEKLGNLLNLPSNHTGLCTAAQIQNTAIVQDTWEGISVTALVTAGIDENGGRAGDPASWQEKDGMLGYPIGTINLLLHFNCNLSLGALTGALLTATEAKSAAIQELLLPSQVSSGIATGSGTDGAIIICDTNSKHLFTDTGKHSKLGELIGRTVHDAVHTALFLQTGASSKRLHDATRLLGRFGLTNEFLKKHFPNITDEEIVSLCQKEEVWTTAAIQAHLMDLESWNIISHEQMVHMAKKLYSSSEQPWPQSFLTFLKTKL